jgi:hypothetical protein
MLLSAVIPKSYYLFTDSNNSFTVREGVSSLRVISIDKGNYNVTDFITQLTTKLNIAACPYYNVITNPSPYTITISQGKLTFSVVGNGGFQPTFIFTTNVYLSMGFSVSSSNVFISNTLTSTNVINLNPYKVLYVKSSICSSSFLSILDIIPVGLYPDFSFVYYQNTTSHTEKELNEARNVSHQFYITDHIGQIVDLNGAEVILNICLYKREDINDILREALLIHNTEQLHTYHPQTEEEIKHNEEEIRIENMKREEETDPYTIDIV